jgi:hypothetical protein
MKKIFAVALVSVLTSCLFAEPEKAKNQDDIDAILEDDGLLDDTTEVVTELPAKRVGVWPAFFAICEIPSAEQAPDIVGFRVTIPYSTKHESVTGFDIGLWGRALHFEGFMLNLFRNDVKDQLSGFQFGLYNSAVQADKIGMQVGLWNECGLMSGFQIGLVNTTSQMVGFQVGLINRSEEMYGIQVGVVNVIRAADFRCMPLVNIGF